MRVSRSVGRMWCEVVWRLESFYQRGAASGRTSVPNYLQYPESPIAILRSTLRERLRRYPYWLNGHILFAEYSLALRDVAAAYASLQAAYRAAAVGGNKKLAARTLFLLARTYLRAGEGERALAALSELERCAEPPPAHLLAEERAAALVLLERYAEALAVTEQIPENLCSLELLAVRKFCRSRAGAALRE